MTITQKLRDNLALAHDRLEPYVSSAQKTAEEAYTTVHDRFEGTSGMRRADSASDVTVRR